MRKLTNADIKDLREYERERDAFRAEIIAMKKRRRIALGDIMTIVFENAATMRFQIQEMARAERMLRDEQIAHEVETYNELIPADGELSATLFIEITTTKRSTTGCHDSSASRTMSPFVVGSDAVSAGRADPDSSHRGRETTSAVHYLKFRTHRRAASARSPWPRADGGRPPRVPGRRHAHRRSA